MKVKDIWDIAMCPLYSVDGYINAKTFEDIKDCEVTHISTYEELAHKRVRGIFVAWEDK